jgi:uncharacterized protein YbbC (DUF1343 family)
MGRRLKTARHKTQEKREEKLKTEMRKLKLQFRAGAHFVFLLFNFHFSKHTGQLRCDGIFVR